MNWKNFRKKQGNVWNLEIYLLDRLLEDDEIGLKIKRFSINREPVLFATYSARILSLFNRYQTEVISPISLQNYSKLFQQVISLENSIEKISFANADEPDLRPGEAFLQFSKGSSFLLDGANVPYNLQNEWATSILSSKGIKNNEEIIQIIRQMVERFMRNEGTDGSLPENYNWNFWYGHGESGWGNDSNISVNRPDFVGDSSTADNTQKTADVSAILTLGKVYPEILPKDMAAYTFTGVQKGKFYPTLNNEIDALYHKTPGIKNFDLLGEYLSASNNREVGNRFWGFLYLVNSISTEDQADSLLMQAEPTQPESKATVPVSNNLVFAVSLLLILFSSIFLISNISIESPPAYLIGIYLLGFSQIVLCSEIASLMGRLNSQSLHLLLNLLCVFFALAFWLLAKRPRILGPFYSKDFWVSNFSKIIQSFGPWKFLWIFGFGAGLAFAYTFVLIILVPQNVDDVLTTHLARVGYWLQTGSFYPWQTSSYNLPQVISPANAQILIYWTTLFFGEDKLAAMTQWIAAIIAILAIFGICRIMKFSIPKSLFLSLLFITMPSVAIQMSTALTDLIFAALVVACVYLLFLGWNEDNRRILILSSLAFALALGTKQTLLFTLPGLFLTFLTLFLLRKTDRASKVITWTVAAVIFVGLIGSYFYIQNQIVFGRLLGPAEVESAFTHLEEVTIISRIKMIVAGFFSFSFQTIFSEFFLGYIELWGGLFDRIFSLFGFTLAYTTLSPLPYSIGTPSFLVFFMILFGLFANAISGIMKKDPYILSLLSMGIAYLLVLLVIRQFNSAVFRYSILSFALLIPLAVGFDHKIDIFSAPENKAKRILLYSWIVVIALLIMGWTLFNDGAKPTFSDPSIFNVERVKKQTYLIPDFFCVIKSVNELVPEDSRLGLLALGKFPQAALFGKYYSRTVVPIFPGENGMMDLSQYEAVDYLLIDDDFIKNGLKIPGGFKQITTRLEYNIFEKISESPNFQ
ncbi:MAG: ArnT family glycosyltransferase [Anaerolineaceae bacterium]